eukprot:191252-Chlamydomonas_euryale.AAC.3
MPSRRRAPAGKSSRPRKRWPLRRPSTPTPFQTPSTASLHKKATRKARKVKAACIAMTRRHALFGIKYDSTTRAVERISRQGLPQWRASPLAPPPLPSPK